MRIDIHVSSDVTGQLAKASGYDLPSAIKEAIDNSIGAKATKIDVKYVPVENGGVHIGNIIVTDNAEGMNLEDLEKHFFNYGEKFEGNDFISSVSPYRKDESAPNKFGVGIKQAIQYAAPRDTTGEVDADAEVQIITKKAGDKTIVVDWNIRSKRVEAEYDEKSVADETSGTSIIIPIGRHCEPVDVLKIKADISLTYYPFLSNISNHITVDGEEVKMSDPLHKETKDVVINTRKFTLRRVSNKKPFEVIISSTFFDVEGKNGVPAEKYNLAELVHKPARANQSSVRKNPKIMNTLRRTSLSGLFLKTAKRVYTYGCNFALLGYTQHPNSNGLRVEVELPKSFWSAIDMTWNKGTNIMKFTQVEEFNDKAYVVKIEDYVEGKNGEEGKWVEVPSKNKVSLVDYLRELYTKTIKVNSNTKKVAKSDNTKKVTTNAVYTAAMEVFKDEELAKDFVNRCLDIKGDVA